MTSPEGFEEFLARHQDMVYTTAARLLGRGPEAEDVAQETYLKAYERFSALRDEPRAGGWLRTVATNLSLNRLSRHRNRWRLFSELGEEGERRVLERAEAEAADPSAASAADLQEALLSLPEPQRVPLVLFHYEDMSYEAIATKLGVSLAKVKSDIFRGRQALRTVLERQAP